MSETWETIVDIESYPSRTSSYVQVEVLTDTVRGLGARWDQTRTVWGRDHIQTMEVVEWGPPTSYMLRATEAGSEFRTHYLLAPTDHGTSVTVTFTVSPTNLYGRAVTRLMGSRLMASTRSAIEEILSELSETSAES